MNLRVPTLDVLGWALGFLFFLNSSKHLLPSPQSEPSVILSEAKDLNLRVLSLAFP